MPPRAPSLAGHFRRLARNNLWSNHRLYAACGGLSPAELARERRAFFGSIRRTLSHILLIDRYYLAALEGRGADAELLEQIRNDAEPYTDIEPLRAAQSTEDRRLVAFCDRVAAGRSALERVIGWNDTAGASLRDPIYVVLTHLFLHQVHHRGQVHHMLSDAGIAPPQLDEFFLSVDLPRREAELRALGLEPDV